MTEEDRMTEEERRLQMIAEAKDAEATVSVDYSDDDIIIMDNVRLLNTPNSTRLQMNALIFCQNGRLQMDLNGIPTTFERNQLLICPPNTSVTNLMLTPDFDFHALFLTNRILLSFLREKISVWTEVLHVHQMHVVSISTEDMQLLSLFYQQLKAVINTHKDNPYRTEIIQSVLRAGILEICGSMKQAMLLMPMSAEEQDYPLSTTKNLFRQFLNLLGNTRAKHRPVEYYSRELCITAKYLSAVCKKCSGKTANEWIKEQVMEDIRYYLRSTDMSVKQISHLLGFPNTSFFGKYVKEHFGMTPVQFRRGEQG